MNDAHSLMFKLKKSILLCWNWLFFLPATTDYFANNSPAKQAFQPYNNIDGFRYCKEGILLCYLYGEKPIITPFENIASVEKQEDKIYVTLTNGLEVDAYILTE